ncbi:MAG: nitroreductase [Saprospiraceae bacterium]|nr:nitroreductase [Saprospiraceae bacterium]
MDLTTAINTTIKNRRAVFPPMYNGEVIAYDVIEQILENALWAPSHKQTEPWSFKVYSGESLKDLSQYSSNWYKANTPIEKFSEKKYEKTKKKALQSSHVIAIIMNRHAALVPEWEEVAAVACAVQNMWLTATAYGVGAYWSSPKYAIHGDDFFNLEPHQKCLGLMYLGIPVDGLEFKAERAPLEEKVTWI